ncbi:Cerato-platanin [Suillus plorans]|uniref:Cerato-platanin n=1 Tax=Suillus plorans TaxID=116603 RepID=A0A9P7AT07_9AGAM|nr:Cerato-platanin [Suillus plorans]KAG1796034.1 Cerato-platanin [Suillus plorans]
MKFSSVLFSVSVFVLSALAQTTETLSYDSTYDDATLSLSSVACSDGANGLETKGYATLGSLPTFPNVGGVYTVTGWNSAACGACYNVTYGGKSVAILAVDVSKTGFTVSESAMNTLTGGLAVELGRVDATATQVDASEVSSASGL